MMHGTGLKQFSSGTPNRTTIRDNMHIGLVRQYLDWSLVLDRLFSQTPVQELIMEG